MSRLSVGELHSLCLRALRAHGLREPSARLVAESITSAEASGCHSHGVFRLQGYCEALETGRVDGRAEPVLESPAGTATVRVNAQGSFAPAALDLAVPALASAARQHGVAACAVRDAFHFAALWPEAEALAGRGLLALATVNSKAFVANAAGGPPVFGTNPNLVYIPRGGRRTEPASYPLRVITHDVRSFHPNQAPTRSPSAARGATACRRSSSTRRARRWRAATSLSPRATAGRSLTAWASTAQARVHAGHLSR